MAVHPTPSAATNAASVWLLAVAAAAVGLAPARAEAPPKPRPQFLEQALLAHGEEILDFLKAQGCADVGILRFRVKTGDRPFTDNAGSINQDVADRLTTALLLADPRNKNRLGLIRDASAAAAKVPGADPWTSPESRRKLFEGKYHRLWGKGEGEEAAPSGFLTGDVEVSNDLSSMSLHLQFVDAKGGLAPVPVAIAASTNCADLPALGYSCMLRGALFEEDNNGQPAGKTLAEVGIQSTQQMIARKAVPLNDDNVPVKLEIFYAGSRPDPNQSIDALLKTGAIRPIAIDAGAGDAKAAIEEPKVGEYVLFRLTRNPRAKQAFGIVLKVNGVNTLYRQTQGDDLSCSKWVLEAGDGPTEIRGFQTDGEEAGGPLRVLSPAESKREEAKGEKQLGTITLTVFPAVSKSAPAVAKTDQIQNEETVRRGRPPAAEARQGILFQLVQPSDVAPSLKGVVLEEQGAQKHRTRPVPFEADPNFIMAAVITYYHRQNP